MGASKLVHKISKFNHANLCKFIQNHTKKNHKKCFFISQPILIWFALSGRAKLGTLNFYTEFWDFAPLINYGNLCKFIPKITKIASSPSFLDRFSLFVLSDRARWRLQNLYTKFWNSLIMLIYATRRDPGVQSAFFLFIFLLLFIYFFMSLPGRHIYIFLTLIFFFFSPFPGHQMFIFWPVENCTTWNLRYLMLRDAGWALRHWRSW